MRRLLCVGVAVVLAACGSSGGSGKHPDAAGDASGELEAPAAETGGSDAPVEVAAEVSDDVPATESGADAPAGDVADGGAADAASDAVVDTGAEAEAAAPRLVTVSFSGKVLTVATAPDGGMPLGFDSSVRTSAVTGSFTYDLGLADELPNDPKRGKFWRGGVTAFSFALQGHSVTGSGRAIVETEDLDPDTFRFLDGPQGDTVLRTMKLDGTDAPALKLLIAVTDTSGVMLSSDKLPDPFPTVDIANKDGGINISHTFTLSDPGGTLLMQLDTLASQ
jgi:hypothetical protein